MFRFHGKLFLPYCCFLCGLVLRGQCQVQLTPKQQFRNMVDKNEIRETLRRLTESPHIVGSKGEERVTKYIVDTWKKYGFEVEEPEYEVLLSFPQEDKPNKLSIINNCTKEVDDEIVIQKNVTAGRGQDGTIYKYTPYRSFISNGTVEGELVFARLGQGSDLRVLKNKGISLKGKIVLLENRDAWYLNNPSYKEVSGLLFYPGPKYYAKEGTRPNETFPNTPWLPGDAVYSGKGVVFFGDTTTPLLPSTSGMRRLAINETAFKRIVPIQSISYDDARYLLSRMQGDIAPDHMKGKLEVEYRLGPGLKPTKDNPAPVLRLEINNQYVTKKVRNVIATIPGFEEPDRYVLIGNHKDAIVFGGSDASSGTAVLMEISRVLWKLRQNGWKPRRTIKLCSWTGEEEGLIGSIEWIQENLELLKKRAVAYLNTDPTVMGRNLLNVQASPLLGDVILNNAKELQDLANSSITLFESMFKTLPKSKDFPGEPHIYNVNQHVSDHFSFLYLLGLSVADLSYFPTYKNKKVLYPVYHTQYDTFEFVERLADPNFLYSRLMTQLIGGILLDLSDSEVLPFNVTKFAKSAQNAFENLQYAIQSNRLNDLQMSYLDQAIKTFVNMTYAFESAKSKLTRQQKNPLVLRMLNDQMSGLEKTFFSPNALRGLLGDQNARIVKELVQSYRPVDNMLLISEKFNNIYKIAYMSNLTQSEKNEYLKFEMSLIIQAVRDATKLLKPLK